MGLSMCASPCAVVCVCVCACVCMKSCVRVRACDVYARAIEERVVGRRECKRIVFVCETLAIGLLATSTLLHLEDA